MGCTKDRYETDDSEREERLRKSLDACELGPSESEEASHE